MFFPAEDRLMVARTVGGAPPWSPAKHAAHEARADFRHGACFQPSSAPAPLRHHSRESFGPLQLTPAGARFPARRAALRICHWCKFLSQGSYKSPSRGPPSSSLPSLLRCVDHCATQPSGPRARAGRGLASALSNRGRRAVGDASRGECCATTSTSSLAPPASVRTSVPRSSSGTFLRTART